MARYTPVMLSLLCACNGMGDPIGFPDTGTPPGDDTGSTWDSFRELAEADAVLWGDEPGDYAGSTVAFVGDVTGDNEGDLLIGVPADAKGAEAPGGAVLVPGPISGEASLSEVGWAFTGSGTETAGLALAALGDINGDDVADFAVGAPYSTAGGVQRGAVYVFHGPISEGGNLYTADAVIQGASNYALAGWSLASGGDVSGDGLNDLAVGAKWQSAPGAAYAGAVYLLFDAQDGTVTLAQANYALQGEEASDVAGHSVAMVGDVDDDGLADVLIGAVWVSPDGAREHAGGAYLMTSADLGALPEGSISLAAASAKFLGESSDDLAGWDVDGAGDLDGDGTDDLLITAPAHTAVKGVEEAGVSYVVFGPVSGTVELSDADARLVGDQVLEWSGAAATTAGDQDGDGLDDILLGSPYRSPGKNYIAGSALLFTGVPGGDVALSNATVELAGALEYDAVGWSLDGGKDLNGDGAPDVVIGASGADHGKDADVGSVHVIWGRLAGD